MRWGCWQGRNGDFEVGDRDLEVEAIELGFRGYQGLVLRMDRECSRVELGVDTWNGGCGIGGDDIGFGLELEERATENYLSPSYFSRLLVLGPYAQTLAHSHRLATSNVFSNQYMQNW